ncbi:MAG: trypsin-like peptidase domain-containing protein [Verrucomicrobiota bacterium]|jgi:serine protease Do
MNLPRFHPARWLLAAALLWGGLPRMAPAQDLSLYPALPHSRFRSGEETLAAFAPVSAAARDSIVEVNVDGDAVALGTVVEAGGLALTKASEIKPGKLTCWLAAGKEVAAEVLAIDEDDDVALLRVQAQGLKPIRWAAQKVAVGQWAITPALAETPQAVGIISALSRRIRPERAFIGVDWDPNQSNSVPEVHALEPGLGAEKAGVKPGDVIVAVNNELVTTRERVSEILRDFREGQTVQLRLDRDGRQIDAEVKLMAPRSAGFARQRNNRLAGDTSQRAEGFDEAIEHDTVLPPWLCGGPLVNLDGEAIGLNIARASRVATYALPAPLAQKILQTLKAAPASARQTGK